MRSSSLPKQIAEKSIRGVRSAATEWTVSRLWNIARPSSIRRRVVPVDTSKGPGAGS
jgi:hypothetical protein